MVTGSFPAAAKIGIPSWVACEMTLRKTWLSPVEPRLMFRMVAPLFTACWTPLAMSQVLVVSLLPKTFTGKILTEVLPPVFAWMARKTVSAMAVKKAARSEFKGWTGVSIKPMMSGQFPSFGLGCN